MVERDDLGDTRPPVSVVEADEQASPAAAARPAEASQTAPPESARAWSSWTVEMAGPGRKAAQVAALVGQQCAVAAVRFDEPEPRPVDDGRDQCRDKAPSPGGRRAVRTAIRPGCSDEPERGRQHDDHTREPAVIFE